MTKWWDGYRDEPIVLIEDFDVYSREYTRLLKLWADQYAFPVEVKGGSMTIRPLLIVVTSQYSISRIWQDCTESRQAISRRFVELHKTSKNGCVLGGYRNFFNEHDDVHDGDVLFGNNAQEEIVEENVEVDWENLFSFN